MGSIFPKTRKMIVHKWCTIPAVLLSQLAIMEGVSIGAVRNAFRKYGEDCCFQDKPKSGRKPGPVDGISDRRDLRAHTSKKSASVRDVAKKVGLPLSTVYRAKVRLGLKTYKKQKKPKRRSKQAAFAKPRARKLYNQLFCGKSV